MQNIYRNLIFLNNTILWYGMQQVAHFLQGPTLVYHDDSAYVDIVLESIIFSRTIVVVKAPELPEARLIYRPQSTILLATEPKSILVPHLREWQLWNPHGRILVIVNDPLQVHNWIERIWNSTRAADVVVMLLAETVEFFTWFPYQPEPECRKVVTIAKLEITQLFPQKISPPLNNCPLIGVASPLPPIVVDNFNGLEPRLFFDLAEKLGMRQAYVDLPPKKVVWAMYNETDHSPINGLKLLRDYDVDLILGQMSFESSVKISEGLVPHLSDQMVWFVPGPQLAPKAAAIYLAFKPIIWIFIIISYIALFAGYLMISSREISDTTQSFIQTLALTVNLPHNTTVSRALNVLIIASYAYSLHITTAFQSSLMVFLSDSPREPPIRNLKDLSETNLTVEFHQNQANFIESYAKTVPEFIKLREENRIRYTTYLSLPLVDTIPRIALLGPKIAFKFNLLEDRYYDETGHPTVLMLPKPVFHIFAGFHLALGHPLQPLLKKYLQFLIEAGMPQHYIDDLSKPVRPSLRIRQPFGIENVWGCFQLYLGMMIISTISWLLEWAYYSWELCRHRKLPNYGKIEWGGPSNSFLKINQKF